MGVIQMSKGNIVVIDAVSSAANYIQDIRDLGFNPVCLELFVDDAGDDKFRKLYDKHYLLVNSELPDVLPAEDSYEKTLKKVKELNPLLVLPGTDGSIEWATRMGHDLGLPSNNPDNIKKMTDKQHMQEALKKSNLRHIRSKVISSYEEAEEFMAMLNTTKVVVKPSFSTSTIGVCICNNRDEVMDAFVYNKTLCENKKDVNILIQEYVGGEEYIVDSICCKGHNRVIAAAYYNKMLIEGRGSIYDYADYIDESNIHLNELREYNDKVLSSIGLEYGVCHAEYKIDENGPVLIEVNCRPSGPSQKASLLDKIWGEHPTALSLESYLNPEESIKKCKNPINRLYYYCIKSLIMYDDIYVIKSNLEETFDDLDSFEYAISIGDNRVYPKTIDLATCGGLIFLTNKNRDKLMKDIDTIKRMEKNEIERIFDIK